jgi:hypothetical protein
MPGRIPGPIGINAEFDRHKLARKQWQPPQPLGLQLVQPAPQQAMSIKQFIQLVEAEEARYPIEEQQNTKLMITRLRKIFYGKDGWDKYLIEGAKDIQRPYHTESIEQSRSNIPIGWALDIEVVRERYSVTDRFGQTPKIAQNQEIRLPNGSYIDIGHVFAGLDAINFPQEVGYLGIKIDKNVDAATWVGDLGSALAEIQFKALQKHEGEPGSLTHAEINAIICEYASPQDMLGNIDTYVIKTQYDISKSAQGTKVSEILRRYYLIDPAYLREHRYSVFAGQVGLEGWDGAAFTNENEWVDDYTDQVNDAAALYIGANTEGMSKYPAAMGMSGNQGAATLVRLFLQTLKTRIRSEPK